MISAFGVEHDNITKNWAANLGNKVGGAVQRKGKAMKIRSDMDYIVDIAAGRSKLGQPKALNTLRNKAGKRVEGLGSSLLKNPEATGVGIAAGGATVGAGGAASLNNRRKKKVSKQFAEGLDDALGRAHDEDEAKKLPPRYVRNEKGQFLSNRPAAPFGVPHYYEEK
jgi:hypothetical protein